METGSDSGTGVTQGRQQGELEKPGHKGQAGRQQRRWQFQQQVLSRTGIRNGEPLKGENRGRKRRERGEERELRAGPRREG